MTALRVPHSQAELREEQEIVEQEIESNAFDTR